MTVFPCDLCGSADFTPLEVARPYVGDQQVPVICKGCGFVYVRERRSHEAIIDSWKQMYRDGVYKPSWPGVRARLFYVAEWLDQNYGLMYKTLYDLGSGDGFFIGQCIERGAHAVGSDPAMPNMGIAQDGSARYDFVTLNWTLENCRDCLMLLREAASLCKPTGRVVVATGSRILVPPRKYLSGYFSTTPADTHAFRWAFNSLCRAFVRADLLANEWNDYEQNDVLLIAAEPVKPEDKPLQFFGGPPPNDYDAVLDHFARWAREWP